MHLPLPVPHDDEFYIQMNSAHDAGPDLQDPFTEVFASDPSESDLYHNPSRDANNTMSLDARRLRAQHSTEGYREGITAGKAESIQAGFDEGYGLGANVGLRAGQVLGLLEGIAAALRGTRLNESAHADQLLSNARKELSIKSIFDGEYWAPNGTWKYTVEGSKSSSEILFEDVANQHPIIMKWAQTIDDEVKKWSLNRHLPILDNDSSQQHDAEGATVKVQNPSRQTIDW
ncbi:essential protein Yae1 [Xylariaceae sp. FL0662B]|nr:essential protein Yae1 [Xylariaceae sp. FL0662B]